MIKRYNQSDEGIQGNFPLHMALNKNGAWVKWEDVEPIIKRHREVLSRLWTDDYGIYIDDNPQIIDGISIPKKPDGSIKCNFCYKSSIDTSAMFTNGGHTYICKECVDMYWDKYNKNNKPQHNSPEKLREIIREIKKICSATYVNYKKSFNDICNIMGIDTSRGAIPSEENPVIFKYDFPDIEGYQGEVIELKCNCQEEVERINNGSSINKVPGGYVINEIKDWWICPAHGYKKR